MNLTIRDVRDSDSPGIVALLGLCFSQYPGCVLDVNEEETGVLTPTSSFAAFWVVVDDDNRVRGTIACQDYEASEHGPRRVELKKLYLHPATRGQGMARKLCDLVVDWARQRGHDLIDLWTDTRFETAHGVYSHLGWSRTGEIRDLNDQSETKEYYFVRRLD